MTSISDIPVAISALRKRFGLSQKAFAKELGESLVAVSRWEDGTAIPSPSLTESILSWHLGGSRPKSPTSSTFASRGIGPRLEEQREGHIELSKSPNDLVLNRVSDSNFVFPFGGTSLEELLAKYSSPASTATQPPIGGISAGKNTYTYDAHTYHTKVPPQGIAELLRHYLPNGGLVLDPFAGSGMTGVAAIANNYGCILNELSPAASFISSRFCSKVSHEAFMDAVAAVLESVCDVRQNLYTTICRECEANTELLYTVWSYRVQCYHCNHDFQLWDHCRTYGRTVREHKILTEFNCPSCSLLVKKSRLPRSFAEPVEIGYKCCGSKQREVNHPPNKDDLNLIDSITKDPPIGDLGFPTDELPDGVNLRQPKKHGLTSVDKFYTTRNLAAMSQLWTAIHRIEDPQLAAQVAFAFTGLYRRVTKFSEFRFWGGSGNSARLNVPYIYDEVNVFTSFKRKAQSIADHLRTTAIHYSGGSITHIGSATDLDFIPNESVDFIFTDPPFGANINYSEMNFLWESWLKSWTNPANEAIVNKVQGKDNSVYGSLMTDSFRECYRVLRTGSWMLLVFMNSSAAIWEEIRAAVINSGFEIVGADVFDKQHGTFKHFVSPNTTGSDLVIHCYKGGDASSRTRHQTIEESLMGFLRSVNVNEYRLGFLHVNRADEFDFRTLYSEWISKTVVSGAYPVDFVTFRSISSEVLGLGSS